MNERIRLEQLMESEKMNAKQFAQEVGIQAGTISNIMSGRNNPSLEVLQRVLNRFRTVSSDWLILGSGQMYRANGGITEPSLFDIKPIVPDTVNASTSPAAPIVPTASTASAAVSAPVPLKENPSVDGVSKGKMVAKITIFYTDGTFEDR